ncbi:tRNA-dihydrouridine synthase [Patulibacter sp.]|uniref:tRNA-dihydrouridine synthase n=1 Tax=Patulibacter sp. TaxID=1912859 RepID=UPI00271971F3|nr:tRNA-dihydrouridine synthase [Patulibacter sp.]MDO9408572.1 tRNA-dihydrouridine synthase [Patulibacter sp.]
MSGAIPTATSVAGVALEHPLLNAAGTAKSLDDVRRLARSPVAAVTLGSITKAARDGNAGEVYASRQGYAVNALGMPNRGADFYRDVLPEMAAATRAAGKPLIVSVAGFSPEENGELAHLAADGGCDLVELNLGCPNVWDGGEQKRIMSFDPELVSRSLAAASGVGVPVGVKLSPLSDPVQLAEVAAAAADAGARFVVSCNTFPNGLALRADGRAAVDVGYGGVSGAAMKPVVLGQVSQLRALLPEGVDVVGCGGVRSGQDVRDLLAVGAVATGLATAFWDAGEDPGVFADVLADWLG